MENRMESMMDEMGDANPLSLMMNMGQPMGGEENRKGTTTLSPAPVLPSRWASRRRATPETAKRPRRTARSRPAANSSTPTVRT